MGALETTNLVILLISASISTIGNALVAILIVKFDYLQTKQNAFILCLAISDFLYGFIVVPMRIVMNNVLYHANISETSFDQWVSGCQTVAVFNVIAYYGDYLSIALITLDRFLYIKYPFKYTQNMTNTKTACAITGICIVSFSLSILFIFVPDDFLRGELCFVSSFIQFEYFIAFDVPLLAITCTGMFYTFYIYHTMVQKTQPNGNNSVGSSKTQNKVTKMMLMVVSVFLLSNTFWYTVYFITNGMNGLGTGILQEFASWLWHVSKYASIK